MDILIEQEIALHKEEVRQSKCELERLIHLKFTEIGESGKQYDYRSIIKMLLNSTPQAYRVHAQEFSCSKIAEMVQILLYKSARIDSLGNVSNFTRRSSVWVAEGDLWQLIHHQGTACSAFDLKSDTSVGDSK